jgi:hypothetical protein
MPLVGRARTASEALARSVEVDHKQSVASSGTYHATLGVGERPLTESVGCCVSDFGRSL